jgi:hypothetical protein
LIRFLFKTRGALESRRFDQRTGLRRNSGSPLEFVSTALNQTRLLSFYLSMIFSENRFPPRIKSGAGFFGIMLLTQKSWRRLDAVASIVFRCLTGGPSQEVGDSFR